MGDEEVARSLVSIVFRVLGDHLASPSAVALIRLRAVEIGASTRDADWVIERVRLMIARKESGESPMSTR